MSNYQNNELTNSEFADPRWKDLYKIGWITAIISILIVLLAITAFFIWPYAPGTESTEAIFSAIQTDKLGVLMSLDFFLLIGILFSLPLYLAIYIPLKDVNQPLALIALTLGLIAVVSIIPARPIMELFALSDLYTTATTDAARDQYIAAGEALLVIFDGTAWAICTIFTAVSFIISSLLMLKSKAFKKSTAYVGIIADLSALGFAVPIIGPILLFIATIGGLVFCILLARDFFRLEHKAIGMG